MFYFLQSLLCSSLHLRAEALRLGIIFYDARRHIRHFPLFTKAKSQAPISALKPSFQALLPLFLGRLFGPLLAGYTDFVVQLFQQCWEYLEDF